MSRKIGTMAFEVSPGIGALGFFSAFRGRDNQHDSGTMKDRLIAAAVSAAVGFSPTSGLATPQRTVAEQTVISQGDPAVEIKLPGSAEYVGMERFLLSKPTLGNTESCEQYAFV